MSGLGILGGTFNPLHNGHIRLALEAGELLKLDKVFLTPCAQPPHKDGEGILPFKLRVQCIREAVKGIVLLEVNTLEGELKGPSYTWNSLKEWRSRHPEAGLPFFIMGSESFSALHLWHRGEELPQIARLVMVPRDGEDGRVFCESIHRIWPGSISKSMQPPSEPVTIFLTGGGTCLFLPVPRLDISATVVRDYWRKGRRLEGLVPPCVLSILEKHRQEVDACWGEEDLPKKGPFWGKR